jgi:hypothetical protein
MKIMMKGAISILVCMLMIISTIIPISAATLSEKSSLKRGDTLYVGGSGPNNFTYIQDAINAASNGYTVFVFKDSSPYKENLYVRKSINLIGEDRNTTIIDGRNRGDVIDINYSFVTISGFTIQHSGLIGRWRWEGILTMGSSTTIKGNIIQKNNNGIALTNLYNLNPHNLCILNNVIQNNRECGINSRCGVTNSTISGNVIAENGNCGIALSGTINSKNIIVGNIITGNHLIGIIVYGNFNNVTGNTVQNTQKNVEYCRAGISIEGMNNSITRNNLINNSRQAFQFNWGESRTEISNMAKENNTWDGNYWGEPLTGPQRIAGRIYLSGKHFSPIWLPWNWVPWIAYDSHPAQAPYTIP